MVDSTWCVGVMQQLSAFGRESALLHGDVARHLFHLLLIRMEYHTCELDPPALQMNEQQHIMRFQPFEREHFSCEKIRSHHYLHVSADEILPTCRLLSLQSGWNIMP
jgi:hypothetical protein